MATLHGLTRNPLRLGNDLNLFLCKIIDELENPNELKFNYRGKRYDDIYAFSDRLQQLYQKGMMKFLQVHLIKIF